MADLQNIGPEYFTGEDKSLRFTIATDGVADDITGWTLSWMVKATKRQDDDEAVITKTTAAGISLTTPLSGILTISIDDDDIAAIYGGKVYYHELKRVDTGLKTVLSHGTFKLNQAVHN